MKWLFLSPIPKLFDKVIILRATPCCVFGRDADGWGVPARPFVTHLALLSLPFVLCLGRSPHCVHWRARSKELPPEEAPQTQVQPQGETGADGAQFRGSQVRRWRIQCKHPQTSEWVRLHQRIVCVLACWWMGVFQAACKSQLTGYQSFFCWGGKKELWELGGVVEKKNWKNIPQLNSGTGMIGARSSNDAGFSGSGFRLQWMEEEKQQKKPRMFHNRA